MILRLITSRFEFASFRERTFILRLQYRFFFNFSWYTQERHLYVSKCLALSLIQTMSGDTLAVTYQNKIYVARPISQHRGTMHDYFLYATRKGIRRGEMNTAKTEG